MNKKRLLMLLTAILVIALAFTLVACGEEEPNVQQLTRLEHFAKTQALPCSNSLMWNTSTI